MSARSHTSFQKRQKEIARMEKQRDKAAKRAQRKLAAAESPVEEDDAALASVPPQPDPPVPADR
jgi:hypothetical protein